jgi:hypothetical protein
MYRLTATGTASTRPLYSFLVILCLGPLDTAHRVVADRVHLAEVVAQVESVDPGMVMLDPWSAVQDDEAKEYLETSDAIRRVPPWATQGRHRYRGAHAQAPRGRAGQ